jgi:hypothetical protein
MAPGVGRAVCGNVEDCPDELTDGVTEQMGEENSEAVSADTEYRPPGWYDWHGGQRLYDGEKWTEHYAPPAPWPSLTVAVTLGVAFGMLFGWFAIRLGAETEPDLFFWPIKVVVEDIPLPSL